MKQKNGKPFLDDYLARYGYLPNPDPANTALLPVGFTNTASPQGSMVGMTCSACHVRQINAGAVAYRIDGGPAIADFQAFVADLDDAVARVLTDDVTFRLFAEAVVGKDAANERAVAALRADVDLWWQRYHLLMSRFLPTERPWGPSRLDAMSMIFNRLGGLDLGSGPARLIAENIQKADAPTRYPFLWNSARQDLTQWPGFSQNGNDFLALTRNLGQLYGVFGSFHPMPLDGAGLNRDYLSENSANFVGLGTNEALVERLGAPVWPFPVDRAMATTGQAIFERPTKSGGCVACHGIRPGMPRPPNLTTFQTPIMDVGTDTREWNVILRPIKTASMEGASIPGAVAPLKPTDLALSALKVAVLGAIVEYQAATAPTAAPTANRTADDKMKMKKAGVAAAMVAIPHSQMDGAMKVPNRPQTAGSRNATPAGNAYEARVLQGIWAAAPYLHNGSVPTLADLLEPANRRPATFEVGPAYDTDKVGLASHQTVFGFTLRATGCGDRNSGDSNCGHDYGTRLGVDEKKALLEYLKTL